MDYETLNEEILKKLDLLASKMFAETATRPEVVNHKVYDYKCLRFRMLFSDAYLSENYEGKSEERKSVRSASNTSGYDEMKESSSTLRRDIPEPPSGVSPHDADFFRTISTALVNHASLADVAPPPLRIVLPGDDLTINAFLQIYQTIRFGGRGDI